MTDTGHGLLDDAAALLGRPTTHAASAPGRVNLIGEHTDYNDGFVLPFAIDQRCAAAVATREDGQVVARSTATDEVVRFALDTVPGDVCGWASYVAGVVWALRRSGVPVTGADIAIHSDVWQGAGLSSSAAIEGAVALALGGDTLGGPGDDRRRLVHTLVQAENDYVGAPTGILDQSASLRCRADHLLLMDCRTSEVEHVPLDLEQWGLTVLTIDSRTAHSHVDGEYAERRAQCEQAATELGVDSLRDVTVDDVTHSGIDGLLARRARHVVTENQRVLDVVDLLRDGTDPRAVGDLLTASHRSMRDDYDITVPEVDLLVDTALAAGAHGARMTGGGFGGCVLALVDIDLADDVATSAARAATSAGHPTPRSASFSPSAGGRVESPHPAEQE